MTSVSSSCAAMMSPSIGGGGVQSPVQAPVQGSGAAAAPAVQSPMQVPVGADAAQAAAGGAQLLQDPAATAPIGTAPATDAAGTVPAGAQPVAPQEQTAVAGVAGGGDAQQIDMNAVISLLTELTTVVTKLAGVVAAQAQARAGAAGVQGQDQQAQADGSSSVDAAGGGAAVQSSGCGGGCGGSDAPVQEGANAAPQVAESTTSPQQDDAPAPAKTSSSPAPSSSSSAQLPPKSGPSRKQIDAFLAKAATAYGANGKILSNIAKYESTYRPTAVNGTHYGMFQYLTKTFDELAPRAKKANPEAWKGLGSLDHKDWRQQALTTAWAIEHGYAKYWSTYKTAARKA